MSIKMDIGFQFEGLYLTKHEHAITEPHLPLKIGLDVIYAKSLTVHDSLVPKHVLAFFPGSLHSLVGRAWEGS